MHRALDAGKARLSIRVVLVEHRDLFDTLPREVTHDFLRFIEVARAHIENVAVKRFAQTLRPGKGANEGDFCLGEDRQRRVGRGRADIAEQGEYFFFVDQFPGVGGGFVGLVAVIQRDQFDLAPVDATGFVNGVEIGFGPGFHFLAEFLRRAGLRGRLADQYRVCRHALGVRRP